MLQDPGSAKAQKKSMIYLAINLHQKFLLVALLCKGELWFSLVNNQSVRDYKLTQRSLQQKNIIQA